MKTAKQEALDLISRLPEDSSIETILAELLFKQTIEERVRQVERGETVTHDEARRKLSKWLTSGGQ